MELCRRKHRGLPVGGDFVLRSVICFLISWLVALYPLSALAESVLINQVPFEVEENVSVDQDNSKITLFGGTHLVPRKDVEDFVLAQYFSKRERIGTLPPASLQTLVENCLNDKNTERAERALTALLQHPTITVPDGIKFLTDLSKQPETIALFKGVVKNALEISPNPRLMAYLILKVGMGDLEWLRLKSVVLVYRYGEAVRTLCEEQYIAAIKTEQFATASSVLTFIQAFFGIDEPIYRKLKVVDEKIQRLLFHLKQGDVIAAGPLIEIVNSDPYLSAMLYPFVTNALLDAAEKVFDKGERERALYVLCYISFERRTPRSHELTAKILSELIGSPQSPLTNLRVAEYLRKLAQKDETLKKAYENALEAQFSYLLDTGGLQKIDDLIDVMLKVRDDPNRANDAMRLNAALRAVEVGDLRFAEEKVRQMQTGLSLVDYVRLFLVGYFINFYVLCSIIAAVILGVLYKLRRKLSPSSTSATKPQQAVQEEEEEAEEEPFEAVRFVRYGGRIVENPFIDEYIECLKVFDLKPGADLKTIKMAYRNAVKEYHPDHNKDGGPVAAEKFIELTKAYDRTLELHEKVKVRKGTPPQT